MLRKVVVSYLVFACVAGPWLWCCCTSARLTALVAFWVPQTDTTTPEQSEAVPSCCCQRAAEEPSANDDEEGNPQLDRPGCPCHARGKTATALAIAPSGSTALNLLSLQGPDATFSMSASLGTLVSVPAPLSATTSCENVSSRQLFSILRC